MVKKEVLEQYLPMCWSFSFKNNMLTGTLFLVWNKSEANTYCNHYFLKKVHILFRTFEAAETRKTHFVRTRTSLNSVKRQPFGRKNGALRQLLGSCCQGFKRLEHHIKTAGQHNSYSFYDVLKKCFNNNFSTFFWRIQTGIDRATIVNVFRHYFTLPI